MDKEKQEIYELTVQQMYQPDRREPRCAGRV